jgi:AraC-like DNA-binding protein
MSTGLFTHSRMNTGFRATMRGKMTAPTVKPRRPARALGPLAEALANGAPTIAAAGREIGVSESTARRMFNDICKALGPQAQ